MIPTHEQIAAAREALTNCDQETDASLREACDLLEVWGDWLDVERARAVRKAMQLERAAPAALDDLAWLDDARAALGAVVWVLVFAGVLMTGALLALLARIGG